MKVKHLLVCITVFLATSLFGQELYPNLTKKLSSFKDSTVLLKIDKIYNYEVKKDPKQILLLKLWEFSLYDSLKYASLKDSLLIELLPKANKIFHPKVDEIYFSAANQQIDLNEYEKGISYLYKGLKVARKYKIKKRECVFLKSIGVAYLKLDDNKTAERYLREALFCAENLKNDLLIANSSISLGNALKDQGDLVNAEKYYQKSLEIALRINEERLIAGNYNNLGNVMRRKKNDKEALKYFFKALEMNIKSGNKSWESFNYHNIANTYDDLKKYDLSIKFLFLSSKLKIELNDSLSLISDYVNFSEVFAKKSEYKNAYEFLNKYVKLNEVLNLKEQSNLLKDLEAKYESEKKLTEINQLKMGSELQKVKNFSLKLQAHKNRNILILSIIALISLIIGIGILFKTNKRRKQTNELLFLKNNEIEKSNSSLQLALNDLSIKNKEVIDSINYATYIQQAALPNISQIISDQLQFELFFVPKDIVSGDFYFSYQLYKKSIFGVADCTGHGVPGAMVSLIGMNSLDKVVREEKHELSSSMVDSVNIHVQNSLSRGGDLSNDGMDISFCYLNHEDNVLHFTGANHNAYILRKNQNINLDPDNNRITVRLENDSFSLIQLTGVRRPIGKTISEVPFDEVNFQLVKEDRIVLFSDGYADQIGELNNKKLKKRAMLTMLLDSSNLSVKDQLLFMKNGFESWKGEAEQVDDVCLLIVGLTV